MNGQKVATLAQTSGGKLELAYAEAWIALPQARPLSLSLPVLRTPYSGSTVENFFDNLLPDNEPIRKRIQARFRTTSTKCFDLLWHIGRDCIGALQLVPEDADEIDVKEIEKKPLTDAEIAHLLENYRSIPLGMEEEDDFRISLAGAQEKTALLRHEGRWCKPLNTTPTTHIFKLPIGKNGILDLSDSVENEWLCHLILKGFGIPVADASMEVFGGTKALAVTRFDRKLAEDGSWIIRLPQEDICQAFGIPPAWKYERDGGPGILEIMKLLRGSEDYMKDSYIFMKTQLLFWLLAAIDGHAKNFSIFLLSQGRYRLTPIYDVISAYPMLERGNVSKQKLKMAMALRGKENHYNWDKIHYRHWIETARKCGFLERRMNDIMEEVAESMDRVLDEIAPQITTEVAEVAEAVFSGMKKARDRLINTSELLELPPIYRRR